MVKKIKEYFDKNKKLIILLTAFIIYLLITVPVFFQNNHVIKNLEPYPDGILFSLSARNLSMGRGLKLISNWGEVPFWVPPLYTLYLSIFYLISSNILMFYFANILLGLGTIYIIFNIIKKTTHTIFPLIAGMTIYLSHLIVFWLPGLAMTENISLLLFSLLLLGLVENNIKRKLIYVFLSCMGFILVRFSTFPIVLVSLGLLTYQLKNHLKDYLKQIIEFSFFSLLLFAMLLTFDVANQLKSTILTALFNPIFFNSSFIIPNILGYFKTIFYNKGPFLWLDIGVSSFPIAGLFIYSLYKIYLKKESNKFFILVTLFLSLLPLQLLFYTVDARYLIYSIILFSVGIAWVVNIVKNKKFLLLIVFSIIFNIFTQQFLLKELLSNNLLGKSTAWQYQAVLHFNNNLESNEQIITALPPFLIDTYQKPNYRMLPLSKDQEFLQKKQYVWGDDINYSDLITNYKTWLNEGQEIYISNAYITHQNSVIIDFEEFKKEFNLELVSSGCLDACNIYKLNL